MGAYYRLIELLGRARAPELVESNVTMAQLKVLMVLRVTSEMRMSDLAGQLGVSVSTATGLVDRLVEASLVRRQEDPADRRAVLVSLTDDGTRFHDRFQELGSRQLRDLIALLDVDGMETVRRAIELLLDAATSPPTPGPGNHT